jgi:GxxExxY protein
LKIREAFASVWRALGSEFKESVYINALTVEFQKQGFRIEKSKTVPIYYADKEVGNYTPTFVLNDKIVVEVKAVSFLADHHRSSFFNHFKGSKLSLGFLVNFGGRELEMVREISTPS